MARTRSSSDLVHARSSIFGDKSELICEPACWRCLAMFKVSFLMKAEFGTE